MDDLRDLKAFGGLWIIVVAILVYYVFFHKETAT